MAIRVTEADVKEIIATDEHCEPFITIASMIVDDKLVGQGLSDDRLFEIERWLAAHFVAIKDPRQTSESIAGASANFGASLGKGLDATSYGQQVKLLDTTGILERVGQRLARMQVFGKLPHHHRHW